MIWGRLRGRTLEKAFDPRRNSLYAIRLALAAAVIVSHADPLTGHHEIFLERTLGGWAVFGFFTISGFLITRSRLRRPLSDYARDRFLRIAPAFAAMLVAVALVFAPLEAAVSPITWPAPSALRWMATNLPLAPPGLRQLDIGDMSGAHLATPTWNGPIYTLFYEGVAYVAIALLISVLPRCHLGRTLLAAAVLIAAAFSIPSLADGFGAGALNEVTKFGLLFAAPFVGARCSGYTATGCRWVQPPWSSASLRCR